MNVKETNHFYRTNSRRQKSPYFSEHLLKEVATPYFFKNQLERRLQPPDFFKNQLERRNQPLGCFRILLEEGYSPS
jgi:hypothetical protein